VCHDSIHSAPATFVLSACLLRRKGVFLQFDIESRSWFAVLTGSPVTLNGHFSQGGASMKRSNILRSVLIFLVALVTMACAQSDTVMTARIKAGMAADSTVKASEIEVATDNKVVTLTGNLNSQAEKDRALEIARSTSGVTNVVDMLSVRTSAESGNAPDPDRSLGEHIDDAVITAAVKTRLLDDPQVGGLKIDVDTREGVVFLTGHVRSQAESDRAVEVARGTDHVKDVKPNLTIVRG
jgi:hyperosmotically inducible protein